MKIVFLFFCRSKQYRPLRNTTFFNFSSGQQTKIVLLVGDPDTQAPQSSQKRLFSPFLRRSMLSSLLIRKYLFSLTPLGMHSIGSSPPPLKNETTASIPKKMGLPFGPVGKSYPPMTSVGSFVMLMSCVDAGDSGCGGVNPWGDGGSESEAGGGAADDLGEEGGECVVVGVVEKGSPGVDAAGDDDEGDLDGTGGDVGL